MKIDLVPCDPKYAEKYLDWRSDADSLRFNPMRPVDLEDARKQLSSIPQNLHEIKARDFFRWFIAVDEVPCGHVSLKEFNPMMNTAEIGYAIHTSMRGKGITTRALRIAIDRFFKETKIRKLTALIHEENISSRKVIEKLGFKLEGILREHFIIQGKPANEAYYGLLRSEWT